MSDRLSLSCWVKGFQPLTMFHHWEKLVRLFPYSRLNKGLTLCRVLAVATSEPPLFEHGYETPFDPDETLNIMREFQQEDCALQLECYWDLMQFDDEWTLHPAPVTLWCFGPEFENESTDHLRIDFGREDLFLPLDTDDASVRASQANLRSLMQIVRDMSAKLPIERQHLWSESGVNFAKKLEEAVSGAGSGLAMQ